MRRSPLRRARRACASPAALAALVLGAAAASASDPGWRTWLRPLVGEVQTATIGPGDTLLDVAARHGLGFDAVARANPDVDVWIPKPGQRVELPTRFVLPEGEARGLVINVPEQRLYDFTAPRGPRVYPVAVGDAEDPTPLGSFRVGEKRVRPAWSVPESIRAERPELPRVVAPGPRNPLGSRWMTIGSTTYGIHGTNNRWSIGRTATHGCVRLYEDDMRELFDRVPSGTPIRIVYQPLKWGADRERIYLEAHPDLYGRQPPTLNALLAVPRALDLLAALDLARVEEVAAQARGVPFAVGDLPAHLRPRTAATSRSTS
jgi:L,D-transpeptidase ErfK/SrfK